MLDVLRRFRSAVMLGVYLVASFVLLLSDRDPDERRLGTGGSIVFHGVAATERTAHFALAGLGELWDRYIDLVRVNEENERLRAELAVLREEHTRLLGVMQENARLRAMVGFQEAHPTLELVPARVVAVDDSPFFRVVTVTIAVRDSRIEVGNAVVSSAGVVGHISEISGGLGEVILAVDARSEIDVLVQRNRARGIVVGQSHESDYMARISYLLRREEVRVGDVVVTSGMGGRFPPDLMVGRVAALGTQTYGLFQEVVVEPTTDFSRLEEVFVITGEVR